MDARKKIFLKNQNITSQDLEDVYVDINLSRGFREIKPSKYDNIFDLTKFYNQERNSSRNFVLYGTIDSYLYNCNNLLIEVYQSPTLTLNNLLCTAKSKHIVNENMPFINMYNKIKGKYIIDNIPSSFTGYSVYLKVKTTDQNPPFEQVVEQQLIFTTLTITQEGVKVVEKLNYGINEAITDCDGNTIEVNNDFDFFYNKHWIKNNISLVNDKTVWIGDEATKSCEITINPVYHNRVINGTFLTGNFVYGRTMEVYEINPTYPTGVSEQNISGVTQNYIPPYPSNGICKQYEIYNFVLQKEFLPPQGLVSFDAPINGVNVFINPDDFDYDNTQINRKYWESEKVSVLSEINNNLYWEFKEFMVNGQQVLSTSFDVDMTEDKTITAIYQGVCATNSILNISANQIWSNITAPVQVDPSVTPNTEIRVEVNGVEYNLLNAQNVAEMISLCTYSPISIKFLDTIYYRRVVKIGQNFLISVYNLDTVQALDINNNVISEATSSQNTMNFNLNSDIYIKLNYQFVTHIGANQN